MRKLKLNASLTAPLDPSDEGRATGGSDSSSRRTHALEGLATLAQCQPSVAEWLRLCLAVRCLCLLQMGRQGPAEGSVLDDADEQDEKRRLTHQAATPKATQRCFPRGEPLPPVAPAPDVVDPLLKADDFDEDWLHPTRPAPTPAATVGPEALARQFCGEWVNTETEDLDEYLQSLGVGWAKRKVATSFKPEASWAIVDGVLQVLTPTPIGDRLEAFRLGEKEADVDPDGNRFWKSSQWEGGRLVTTALDQDGVKPPFITERWIAKESGLLMQKTTHGGASFTRIFSPKIAAGA